jgi:uncharacterized protein YndB with AHSA1/START domain
MLVLWIFLGLLGLLVLAGLVMWVLGRGLPEEHVSSSTLHLRQEPEAVWAVVSDCKGHKSWSPGVTKVERLPEHDGHEVWRQRMGRNSFVLETTRADRPRVLVRTIADDHGPFSGRWEYRINPAGGGCKVTLTEHGRIKSAVPRFVMRYMVGEDRNTRAHLEGLARIFHETPVIE